MVGVPRSGGCGLCLQRRVKCDQAKPWCQNCSRYGAQCPGYHHELKFVANKHRIRQRGRRDEASKQTAAQTRAATGAERHHSQSKSSPDARAPETDLRVGSVSHSAHNTLALPRTLQEPRGPYISTLLDTLHAGASPDDLAFLYPWFQGMQAHVGTKVTLDSAIMSLVLQMLGKRVNDSRLIDESHVLYGRSLAALQLALNSKSEWRTTETLCTTVLLCHFEMFAGTGSTLSWMKHANALGFLIERRGPQAYRKQWDLSIFNTTRTAIIFNCFWSGKDCFLAEPRWENVIKKGIDTQDSTSPEAQRHALVNDYVVILAKLPGIMSRTYPLFQAHLQGCPFAGYARKLSSFADHINEVYQSLVAWSARLYADMPPPIEVPTSDEASPWPTILSFENVWFGALYMGFWTVRLILQMGLELIRGRDPTFEDDKVLLSNILRSCETVGEGIMGPYRIGFGIRCAYDLADAPTRLWIKSKLATMHERYASLDTALFVSPDE